MKITQLNLPGVLLVEPDVYEDARGFFLETWSADRYEKAGFPDVHFVQDNHSRSTQGVLRGLHYQLEFPQGKLIQVARGEVFDVAVDIRVGSPTFGQWAGCRLSDANHQQLWVPPGFAHGFCALSDEVDLTYKCTGLYHAGDDYGILWNDSDIKIDWPVSGPLLSDKDSELPSIKTAADAGDLPVYSS